jgi:signal transduction histidine kinase
MPQVMTVKENERVRQHLTASFMLAGYLLEAYNEEAAILSAMRVSAELLGAEGCAFLPFSEWKRSIPVLTYGETAFLHDEGWLARLFAPGTRHACRICEKKRAASECVLIQEPSELENVFCIGLHCDGRVVGNISYFFSSRLQISDDQHLFLDEMVRLMDLTLSAQRVHERKIEAAKRACIPLDHKNKVNSLDSKTGELLQQLEYKAILDERSRLAREIHDGLAQTLAFLKLEAARMQTHVSNGELEAVIPMLQACYQTLSDAYLDARHAIDNLRQVPDELLADWLQAAAADFRQLMDIKVDVSNVQLSHVFSPNVKAQLMRIVQEALTNVRKHAQACNLVISSFERGGEAIIEVRDNGRGFNPDITQPASQYGLRSMRERAESIGAELEIASAPNAGTAVRLRIPIQEKAIHE